MSKRTSALRILCGELEDMSVFKDNVKVMEVRARLEPAVEEMESELKAVRDAMAPLADLHQRLADRGSHCCEDCPCSGWEEDIYSATSHPAITSLLGKK